MQGTRHCLILRCSKTTQPHWVKTLGVLMDSNDLALLERLGREGVLAEMAKGDGRFGRPGSQLREEVELWLRLKESEIALSSSSKRDAREEETLAIAKEANAIARSQSAAAWRAARYSMYAAIIATIAAIIATLKT